MFITPITPMGQLSGLTMGSIEPEKKSGAFPFQQIFENAIQNMKETEAVSNNDAAFLATGDIDDLHTLGINATKAYLSERLVVELRNRAMEAYSEVMRINL